MKKRIGWLALLASTIALIVVVPVLAAPSVPNQWPQFSEYPDRGQRDVRLAGTVVGVLDRTVVLDIPLGQLNVQTDGRTRFAIPGVESPSIADIEVGMKVVVQGSRQGWSLHARVVRVLPENSARVQGEVISTGEDAFELAIDDGMVSVAVDERTRFRLPSDEVLSSVDLTVGDRVVVTGMHQDDGTFLARLVTRLRPHIEERRGVVLAVDAESVTVQLPRGPEVMALVTDETVVFVPGVVDAAISDVAVGDEIRVRAEVTGEDALVALRVIVIPPDAAAIVGVVNEVENAAIQVETRTGQIITVQIDGATQIVIPGLESPTLEDLRQSDKVRVGGLWIDENLFSGWVIQVSKDGRVAEVQGRLLSLGNADFTVGSPHGVVSVSVDANTRYRIFGDEEPTFDGLIEGQWVVVRGLVEEDSALRAREVGVKR